MKEELRDGKKKIYVNERKIEMKRDFKVERNRNAKDRQTEMKDESVNGKRNVKYRQKDRER